MSHPSDCTSKSGAEAEESNAGTINRSGTILKFLANRRQQPGVAGAVGIVKQPPLEEEDEEEGPA